MPAVGPAVPRWLGIALVRRRPTVECAVTRGHATLARDIRVRPDEGLAGSFRRQRPIEQFEVPLMSAPQ